jgi:hypothetical protein
VPSVFAKLNLRAQREILVINAPASFEPEIAALASVAVLRDPRSAKTVQFALAFAVTQAELDRLSRQLAAKAADDALLWFAYPKGTSQRYRCEFNRDSGWEVIRSAGFESVRQIAIDEDWSALRFRRLEHIKPAAAAASGRAARERRAVGHARKSS